ncbi:MAG: 4-vinyl reductase [Anaerolineaceae bacterium]|nr:4-vinyl reductase [Anaerolineaceae bacterium]
MTVDANKILQTFLSMGLYGDEQTGLLRRFGVILNSSPVYFLVAREVDFIQAMGDSSRPLSEKVLVDAAQYNIYATLTGILESGEWNTHIAPLVETEQDRLEALVAVINCLGWGKMANVTLDEDKQVLRFDVLDSYYLDYTLEQYGAQDRPVCHLWVGVAGGLMDVLYGRKIHEFKGKELACGAMSGEKRCQFTAKKVNKKFGL